MAYLVSERRSIPRLSLLSEPIPYSLYCRRTMAHPPTSTPHMYPPSTSSTGLMTGSGRTANSPTPSDPLPHPPPHRPSPARARRRPCNVLSSTPTAAACAVRPSPFAVSRTLRTDCAHGDDPPAMCPPRLLFLVVRCRFFGVLNGKHIYEWLMMAKTVK